MENSGGYPGASGPHNAGASNKKLQKTQAQVDEHKQKWFQTEEQAARQNDVEDGLLHDWVVGIMRTNVAKVLERDEKLSELDQRADNLQIGASQFEQQASRLKRKYWWKNLKMMIIIGVICSALLIIILVSVFSGGSSESKAAVHDSNTGGSTR